MSGFTLTDCVYYTIKMGGSIVLKREDDSMIIQDKIRELMDEREWTEYKLSKMAGLSETTITNIFKRNNAPTFATLESICDAFGITLAQFFTEGSNPVVLSDEQRLLIAKWSRLNEKQRSILLELISNI